MMWQAGEILNDRWRVVEVLSRPGTGGMGIVYLVIDMHTYEFLALKTFRTDALVSHPLIAEYFEREAATWLKIAPHPNVVEAQFVEEINGQLCLFLEYASGGNVAELIGLPQLTLSLERILSLSLQLCAALIQTKAAGIEAHGDLKPHNCLLSPEGELKLADFGLAQSSRNALGFTTGVASQSATLAEVQHAETTRGGFRTGTSGYMAPEMIERGAHASTATDIYAFGVILHEMLRAKRPAPPENNGRLPFNYTYKFDLPNATLGNISPELNQVLDRCLAYEPSERFSDIPELRASLEAIFRLGFNALPQLSPPLKQPPERLLERAQSQLSVGRPDLALTLCDEILKTEPVDLRVWSIRAAALLHLERYKEALSAANHALSVNNSDTSAVYTRVWVWLKSERWPEAENEARRLVQLDPESAQAHLILAQALLLTGRSAEASVELDCCLILKPESFEMLFELGEALKALKRDVEALSCLDLALTQRPASEQAAIAKGQVLIRLDRTNECYSWGTRLTRLFPANSQGWIIRGIASLNRSVAAGLNQTRGAAAQMARETKECFERAKALGSPMAQGLLDRLSPELWQDPFDEIAPHIEQRTWGTGSAKLGEIVAEHPDQGQYFWHLQAMFLIQNKQFAEAVECIDRSLNAGNINAEDYCLKGHALDALKRPEEARLCFEQAVALDPRCAEGWFKLALWQYHHMRARNAFAVYRALELVDKALEIDSAYAEAWRAKAEILGQHLGRTAEAEECINKAIQCDQYNAEYWLIKGGRMLENSPRHISDPNKIREYLLEAETYIQRALELGNPKAPTFLKICRELLDAL